MNDCLSRWFLIPLSVVLSLSCLSTSSFAENSPSAPNNRLMEASKTKTARSKARLKPASQKPAPALTKPKLKKKKTSASMGRFSLELQTSYSIGLGVGGTYDVDPFGPGVGFRFLIDRVPSFYGNKNSFFGIGLTFHLGRLVAGSAPPPNFSSDGVLDTDNNIARASIAKLEFDGGWSWWPIAEKFNIRFFFEAHIQIVLGYKDGQKAIETPITGDIFDKNFGIGFLGLGVSFSYHFHRHFYAKFALRLVSSIFLQRLPRIGFLIQASPNLLIGYNF